MLVAAAVCPHPPLLVPELAGGLAADLDACRKACLRAIDALAGADRLVVVGSGAATRRHPLDAVGSLAPYGLDVPLGDGDGPAALPLSLGIGRWLLAQSVLKPAVLQEISRDVPSQDCRTQGLTMTHEGRTALLVMADGSAYSSQTPVGDDGRGRAYNQRIATALTAVDPGPLGGLDPADDGPLWSTGRPALQALAGAAAPNGAPWQGEMLWQGEPYGVGYFVATWTCP